MELDLYLKYGPDLLHGFGVTILCWLAGALLGLLLGLAIALLRRLDLPVLGPLLRVYIEVIRGTPFLVQLFVLYYGGPSIGLRLDAVTAGLLGLAIYGSPYFAEIFRAGMQSIPPGQIEAARCVGLGPVTIFWRIVFPQMLVSILPALTNFFVILTKETAVLSIITVPELLYEVTTMAAETFAFFETLFAVAVFYWLLVEFTAYCGRRLELRVVRHLASK